MKATVKQIIAKCMAQYNIDYFAVVPFDKCIVINENKLQRHFNGIVPKSIIVFIAPYYTGKYPERNISLYAIPRDYHIFFNEIFTSLNENIKDISENIFKGYADSSPIAEVHIAATAGLGMVGDNGLLINEKFGSYVFIGEIITDYEFDSYDEVKSITTCDHCNKCKAACPSKQECLSAITQKRGNLSYDEIKLMQTYCTAWGCDTCQIVCPYNINVPVTKIQFFHEELRPVLDEDCDIDGRAYEWRGKQCIQRNIKLINQRKDNNEFN